MLVVRWPVSDEVFHTGLFSLPSAQVLAWCDAEVAMFGVGKVGRLGCLQTPRFLG